MTQNSHRVGKAQDGPGPAVGAVGERQGPEVRSLVGSADT